jgi:hypothetical protein
MLQVSEPAGVSCPRWASLSAIRDRKHPGTEDGPRSAHPRREPIPAPGCIGAPHASLSAGGASRLALARRSVPVAGASHVLQRIVEQVGNRTGGAACLPMPR